ncbi:MAG: hypothetical protein ABWZ40_09085 [Caulobacterales bacterium]
MSKDNPRVVLLVERDVLIRLAIAEHLRACGFIVIEAAGSDEAKEVLQKGPSINILLSDAQLAGPINGFGLALWVRRYSPGVQVHLTGSLTSKVAAATELCPDAPPPFTGDRLSQRIRDMRNRRSRGAAVIGRSLRKAR